MRKISFKTLIAVLLLICFALRFNEGILEKDIIKNIENIDIKRELKEKDKSIKMLNERNMILLGDIEEKADIIIKLRKETEEKKLKIINQKIAFDYRIVAATLENKRELIVAEGIQEGSKTITFDEPWSRATRVEYTPKYNFIFYINLENMKFKITNNKITVNLSRDQVKLKPLALVNEPQSITEYKKRFFATDVRIKNITKILGECRSEAREKLIVGSNKVDGKGMSIKEIREDAAIEAIRGVLGELGYIDCEIEFIN